MSEHRFRTKCTRGQHEGAEVSVLMGWDRSLQGFTCIVDLVGRKEDDCCIMNHLDSIDSHPRSLEPFLAEMSVHGITVPDEMLQEIERDKLLNVGKKSVVHGITDEGAYHRHERREGKRPDTPAEKRMRDMLADPTVREFAKQLLLQCLDRDIVDSLADLDMVHALLRQRHDEIVNVT